MSTPIRSYTFLEEHDQEIVAEINITPLTDIFLVLLIIFMVTSSAITQNAVTVELPHASKGTTSAVQEKSVVLTLLADGKLRINQQVCPPNNWPLFEEALKKAFLKTTSRMIVLESDKKAFLGSAIEVIEHAKKAGALQFGIATSEH